MYRLFDRPSEIIANIIGGIFFKRPARRPRTISGDDVLFEQFEVGDSIELEQPSVWQPFRAEKWIYPMDMPPCPRYETTYGMPAYNHPNWEELDD